MFHINLFINFFTTLSYPCNDRKSIVFGSNFLKGNFDGITRYVSPESKIRLLAFGLCDCDSVISITRKQNYSRNIKLDILHLYIACILLETFYKDRTKTQQNNSTILRSIEGISCY